MKVLLLNGSPHSKGCTYTALMEIATTLDKHGIQWELVQIGSTVVPGCLGCGKCKGGNPCIIDDGVNALAARLEEFDAMVVGSPIYYAGPSGQCTAFLDRLFYSASDKLKGSLLQPSYPAAVEVPVRALIGSTSISPLALCLL